MSRNQQLIDRAEESAWGDAGELRGNQESAVSPKRLIPDCPRGAGNNLRVIEEEPIDDR